MKSVGQSTGAVCGLASSRNREHSSSVRLAFASSRLSVASKSSVVGSVMPSHRVFGGHAMQHNSNSSLSEYAEYLRLARAHHSGMAKDT
jgi:hypothetical protein